MLLLLILILWLFSLWDVLSSLLKNRTVESWSLEANLSKVREGFVLSFYFFSRLWWSPSVWSFSFSLVDLYWNLRSLFLLDVISTFPEKTLSSFPGPVLIMQELLPTTSSLENRFVPAPLSKARLWVLPLWLRVRFECGREPRRDSFPGRSASYCLPILGRGWFLTAFYKGWWFTDFADLRRWAEGFFPVLNIAFYYSSVSTCLAWFAVLYESIPQHDSRKDSLLGGNLQILFQITYLVGLGDPLHLALGFLLSRKVLHYLLFIEPVASHVDFESAGAHEGLRAHLALEWTVSWVPS